MTKVHVPGSLRRQVVEPKPRRLGVEGGSPSDQPHAVSLGDTLERTAPDKPQGRLDRVLSLFVLVLLAASLAVVGVAWLAQLGDDVRAARAACEAGK